MATRNIYLLTALIGGLAAPLTAATADIAGTSIIPHTIELLRL